MGWRGYAEDSIASYFSWWKESLISGSLWSLWHLPMCPYKSVTDVSGHTSPYFA
jgi:membrane protease YdiL (CAAX protease family)